MKAIEQYFHVVLFTKMYNAVLTFKSLHELLVGDHSNSYRAVLSLFSCRAVLSLFIMLYKVILTFNSVDEILACDHSNESY